MVMKFFIISVCLSMLLFACSKQDNSDNLPVFPDLPHSKIIESVEVGYLDSNNEFFPSWTMIHRDINFVDILAGEFDRPGSVVTLKITVNKERFHSWTSGFDFDGILASVAFRRADGSFLRPSGLTFLHKAEETSKHYIFMSQQIKNGKPLYSQIYFADSTHADAVGQDFSFPPIDPQNLQAPVALIIPASSIGKMSVELALFSTDSFWDSFVWTSPFDTTIGVWNELPSSEIIESAEVGYLDDNNEFFPSQSVIHSKISMDGILAGEFDWQGSVITLRITVNKEKFRSWAGDFDGISASIGFRKTGGSFLRPSGRTILHKAEETSEHYIFMSQQIKNGERFYSRIYFADSTHEDFTGDFVFSRPSINPQNLQNPIDLIIPASDIGRMSVTLVLFHTDLFYEDSFLLDNPFETTIDVRRVN